jgi:6-phosphofructokinase
MPHLGGTILGTTNRGNPFRELEPTPNGGMREIDRSGDVLEAFRHHKLDAHIAVGGDGSLTIAMQLHKKGLHLVGVPKTIDNDLGSTVTTFGLFTAVSFATECLDRLHMTAQAHSRIIVVEVMGRNAGWIENFRAIKLAQICGASGCVAKGAGKAGVGDREVVCRSRGVPAGQRCRPAGDRRTSSISAD